MINHLGTHLPYVQLNELKGKLIVIEGPDGSGRSTQILEIKQWLEVLGYSVYDTGIKRSSLVGEELHKILQGNTLSHRTMTLFYATDFADQLVNNIIPALRSGAIVLCDRYIYTLMARHIVRQGQKEWVEALFSFALKPHIVMYLKVSEDILISRNIQKNSHFNYWESGLDLGNSESVYDSFKTYQSQLKSIFLSFCDSHKLQIIDGDLHKDTITDQLKLAIKPILNLTL